MDSAIFFQRIKSYHALSEEAESAWAGLLRQRTYGKNETLVEIGQHPRKVFFVAKGLLSQNYITDTGDIVIKYFFPELRMAASLSSMLAKAPSSFYITAIEDTTVLEYDFFEFKKLVAQYIDIALFYIRYNEQHWIIEKEPLEISFRNDTASVRYDDFLNKYPSLIKRLKKHHIASYLGITPTQLSRIFFANK